MRLRREKSHSQLLTFMQVADLCVECHRLALLQYFNGNAFASCARVALTSMEGLDQKKQTFSRAALDHYIAGGTINCGGLIAIVPPVLGE